MPVLTFKAEDLFADLPIPVAVKFPIGVPVAETRTRALEGQSGSRTGVWEATPGMWRRQVAQAEMCVILSGSGVFEPVDGDPILIEAGTTHYFPANTNGVWLVTETVRKIFVTFDED